MSWEASWDRIAIQIWIKYSTRYTEWLKINLIIFSNHISHKWYNLMNLLEDIYKLKTYNCDILGACGKMTLKLMFQYWNGSLFSDKKIVKNHFTHTQSLWNLAAHRTIDDNRNISGTMAYYTQHNRWSKYQRHDGIPHTARHDGNVVHTFVNMLTAPKTVLHVACLQNGFWLFVGSHFSILSM